ncbi:MAG: quinoprotein dehydrogenase-associated SoxYZ-like carrier [Bradyrhizobium sp.]
MDRITKLLMVGGFLLCASVVSVSAQDDIAEQQARWREVASSIFGERAIDDGSEVVKLTTPVQAMDASLVPISVELIGAIPVVALSVVIDNNPSPLAGTFRFGSAFVRQPLKMRVRVNEFTLIHAIAEAADGKLYAVARYVKAAGGCSAPAGTQSAEALARIGKMQLRRERTADASVVPSQLLISHPNFSGMQQNPTTGEYTPARFLERISVSVGGRKAFDLDTGISLSEDPAISFTYLGTGEVEVTARDSSSAQFSQHFQPLN